MPASKDPEMYPPEIKSLADLCEKGVTPIELDTGSERSAKNVRNQFNYYRRAVECAIDKMRDDFRLTKKDDPAYNIKKDNYELERRALILRLSAMKSYSVHVSNSMIIIRKRGLSSSLNAQIQALRDAHPGLTPSEQELNPIRQLHAQSDEEVEESSRVLSGLFQSDQGAKPHKYTNKLDGEPGCMFCTRERDDPIHSAEALDNFLPGETGELDT